jgi:tetratricopeptide (TPR) repeat protein
LTPEQQPPAAVVEGNAAFAAGRYDEARGLYVRAVMTDERDGYAKTLYAWANFALGDYEVAAAALRRALLTTPDLVDNPLDLRTFYPDRAVLDRHADALMRFLADHPQHREAQLLWGYLLYSIGQAEPAASVFTSLAGADQNDALLPLLRDAAVRNARSPSPEPAGP